MGGWMQRPAVALALMALGMGFIPLNDALIKVMSDRLPLAQIAFLRGILSFAVVIIFFRGIRHTAAIPAGVFWSFVGRSMCLVLAMVLYFIPLGTLPLTTVVAIFFVSPLLITLLSVPLLGERIGVHRVLSVCIGLVGVLVIMQPGTDGFRPESLLVFGSALSYAIFQIWTRRLKSAGSLAAMVTVQQVCYMCAAMPVLVYNLLMPLEPSGNATFDFLLREPVFPTWQEFGFIMVCTSAVLLLSLVAANAYRCVEASLVAPFEYTAIPFSIIWGIAIWGDWPEPSAWIGMALILLGGLYSVYRERERNVSVASGVPVRGHAVIPQPMERGGSAPGG